MMKVLLLVSLLGIAFAANIRYAAVYPKSDGSYEIIENKNGPHAQGAYAWAMYKESMKEIGWDVLEITGNSSIPDATMAYAVGFLEGAITQKAIWDAVRSFANSSVLNGTTTFSDDFVNFVADNDKWVRTTAADRTDDLYWVQVGLVLAQYDGMVDAYTTYAPADEQISQFEMMAYQLQFEIGDIMNALNPSEKIPQKYNMGQHCSSLTKPTADGKNLFAAHVTWSGYSSMLRIYKHFHLSFDSTPVKSISFSSFPGVLPSGDDFYISDADLVIIETTNEVFNMTLYADYVNTTQVPYWIRVIVANRLATTGEEWTQIFAEYNSGTYNNQWIIVDEKLFTPGQPLQPGTLWISEQVPGFIVSQDMTETLAQQGYWASYNIPYFPFIWNISGYGPLYEQYGNTYSHDECARAKIFRRDQDTVVDLSTMKSIMRYNDYQNDPLSLQDACRGISARCDLNTPFSQPNTLNGWSAFGGIDCKVTDNELSGRMEAKAVSGPTWDMQPPFAWTKQWENVPNYGQPKVFDFDFETMRPTKY